MYIRPINKIFFVFGACLLLGAGCAVNFNVNTKNAAPVKNAVQTIVEARAKESLLALKNKDFKKFAEYAHPVKGVRFSPYSYVEENDRLFMPNQLQSAMNDKTLYNWGNYDGSGLPINLTFAKYYDKFIYGDDFYSAPDVAYNKVIGTGNSTNNIVEAYPNGSFVEYHFDGFDPQYEGMDWKSLRLALEEYDGSWYVVGVVHDEWTI